MYKRQNSTKVPKDTTVSSVIDNVQLKEGTSLYSPTFILSTALIDFEYGNWNYLKWYDRYYFIDDRIKPTIQGAWTITCTLDLLATFKEQILDSYAFVLYSTNKYDVMIPDTRLSYPNLKEFECVAYTPLRDTNLEPSIVISYISAKDSGYGSVAFASLNTTQLQQLNAYLMSEEMMDSLNKQLDSTASAIVSCQLYPFTIPGTTVGYINVLGVDTGVYGAIIKGDGLIKGQKTMAYTSLPEVWYNDFRDLSPYKNYLLFLPCIGYIDVPGVYMESRKGSNFLINYIIDCYTGTISYDIPGLGKFDGSIACNIPTAYSGINAINTIGSGVSGISGAIGSLLSGNVGGAISNLAGGAFNTAIAANTKNCGMIGSMSGSRASLLIQPLDYGNNVLNIALYRSVLDGVEPSTIADTLGRPYNKVIKLSECSGYVQTTKASVELASPKHIMDKVNNLLDSGIYIE